MKCAVVALRDEDEKRFSYFLKGGGRVHEENIVCSQEPVIVYTLDASAGEVCEWKEKTCAKAIDRCIQTLNSMGVKRVHLTKEVEDYVGKEKFEQSFHISDGTELFCFLFPVIMESGAKIFGFEEKEIRIGIWQSELNMDGYDILKMACNNYKCVSIYTNDVSGAEFFTEKLYEKMGASVNVCEGSDGMEECECLILLDETDKLIVNEKCMVVDLCKKYDARCINNAEFSLAFGYNSIMKYFDRADIECVSFLVEASDVQPDRKENIVQYLDKIGVTFKKVLFNFNKKR